MRRYTFTADSGTKAPPTVKTYDGFNKRFIDPPPPFLVMTLSDDDGLETWAADSPTPLAGLLKFLSERRQNGRVVAVYNIYHSA